MTRLEKQRKVREERKINGLCVRCGSPRDRDGIYCIRCNDAYNRYRMENRNFFRDHNLCTICGKEYVPGEERICHACRIRLNSSKKAIDGRAEGKIQRKAKSQ